MCINYTCRSCRLVKIIYCKSADWNQVNPRCNRQPIDPQNFIKPKRCPTCELVEGTIRELRQMVFRQPWLETEGVGGAENRPAWEMEATDRSNFTTIDWNCTEDVELLQRLKAMKLDGLDGKEELNDGHGVRLEALEMQGLQGENKHESKSDEEKSQWGSDEGTVAPGTSDIWVQDKDLANGDHELEELGQQFN